MSADKKDKNELVENKPVSKCKNVLFITDVAQYNYDLMEHPIDIALNNFVEANGNDFNIYVQARYKLDQRTLKSPRVRKMVIKVYVGDVVPALREMYNEIPDIVMNPDYVCTMQGPMDKAGYLFLARQLNIAGGEETVESLAEKWDLNKPVKSSKPPKSKKAKAEDDK